MLYTFGRDKSFRPIVYIDVFRIKQLVNSKTVAINDLIRTLSILLSGVKINMFVDYHVENWITVIDTKKLSLFGFPFGVNNYKFYIFI